jgi:hypothetical protein
MTNNNNKLKKEMIRMLRAKPRVRRQTGTAKGFNNRNNVTSNFRFPPNNNVNMKPNWHRTPEGRKILMKLRKYGILPWGNTQAMGGFGGRNKKYVTKQEAEGMIKREEALISNVNKIVKLVREFKGINNNTKNEFTLQSPFWRMNTSLANKLRATENSLKNLQRRMANAKR